VNAGRGKSRECKWSGGLHQKVAGLTLVELLVVLSILAVMAAVAIPSFARMGYFSKNEVQSSSRELYAMLKAAKVYAATYRVSAGIAYQLPDPILEGAAACIHAVATVYRLEDPHNPDYGKFVPVASEGGFKPMTGGTCIERNSSGTYDDSYGFTNNIVVKFPDSGDVYADMLGNIFEPSGKMTTSAEREMFTLTVGIKADDSGAAAVDTRTVPIHLFRSTGRVKIGNEEG
jgi:prepilin-type N-terminal cleavage/methylation domain-containing protein